MGKQNSPRSPPPSWPDHTLHLKPSFAIKKCQSVLLHGLKNDGTHCNVSKGVSHGRKRAIIRNHARLIAWVFLLMGCFFLMDSLMLFIVQYVNLHKGSSHRISNGSQEWLKDEKIQHISEEKTPKVMYGRLLKLASRSLAENQFRHDSSMLWEEPYKHVASAWRPCANKHNLARKETAVKTTGFILVTANGGLNQQRVAVCNAVAVASLLNATLVLPKFLYSSVWKDASQFGDIYQEEYFMNVLENDVNIIKGLPSHLQSVDIEAIGSLITDMDIMKESKPTDFVKAVLPLLRRNGVVHFLGFGNRLAFDPLSFNLQRLRCKCNFHALKFVPKIQQVGSLLVQRIRNYGAMRSSLDRELLGKFISTRSNNTTKSPSKYLALHMRFEMDMVAYSQCDFGGEEKEKKELQAYREIHFPTLVMRTRDMFVSPAELRKWGRCPLTPEEAALMLSALGYKRDTYIYLAGSHIYGGQSRLLTFTGLYPNLVTKEELLKEEELAPFMNFSSQLAALDFIACAASDVFAMTDSGSQLSSLVTGYRTYYGGGLAPTLRPNKKRLARIMSENNTIEWIEFEERVRKMIEEGQRVRVRRVGRSIYRQPRCPQCMCKAS